MHPDALPPCDSIVQHTASFLPEAASDSLVIDETVLATQRIAPWWHTAAIVVLLGVWALVSAKRSHTPTEASHWLLYLSTIVMSWMLFGSVVAGIYDRGGFFFRTLRHRAHSFAADAAAGCAVYISIYATFVAIAMIVGIGILSYRSLHPEAKPAASVTTSDTTTPGGTLPTPAPVAEKPVNPFANSPFHFNSKAVLALAPRRPIDLLLWFALSATAGFCEEHIFRGYLLKQAIALLRGSGRSRLFANILAIICTSLLFGSLHLYEGIGGAIIITALGAIYSVIALQLGNLRAVIVAHFLQDFVAGLFLFFFHSLLAR